MTREQLVALLAVILIHADAMAGAKGDPLEAYIQRALKTVQAAEKAVADLMYQEAVKADKGPKP